MPPLILHHVPDDELYTGEDGVQRPFAMLFTDNNDSKNQSTRSRRTTMETGSFGKSTRRSKSRTGIPIAKQEDPTLAAADTIFSQFIARKAAESSDETPHPLSNIALCPQSNMMGTAVAQNEGTGLTSKFPKHRIKEPTEVILRGFKPSQQYAAIREYEHIAGRICEDYPRDPPIQQRRYKVDSGDIASLRHKALTADEKAKVYKYAGGHHWIKVTFESLESAETAIECSPQKILGHLVIAELYRGIPPLDEEILATNMTDDLGKSRISSSRKSTSRSEFQIQQPENPLILESSHFSPFDQDLGHTLKSFPQSASKNLSSTDETGLTGSTSTSVVSSSVDFCERIPSARKLKLLPAEQALLPQKSPIQKFIENLPFIGWVSKDIIGGSIPRNEQGEFDYLKASLYWRIVWMIERITGIPLLDDTKED